MQGHDKEVVPLPPLDGSAGPHPALVPSGENELQEPLDGHERNREYQ